MTTTYWSANALKHQTPQGKQWPEGWDPRPLLRTLVGTRPVAEIGCGRGRLAGAFSARSYRGYDVCADALDEAREAHPQHTFTGEHDQWTGAVLFYTVLLHVSDEDLPAMVAQTRQAERVIVAEIMGRKWRRDGLPPAYNREALEYVAAFERRLANMIELPYLHYPDTKITFLVLE